jgi:shikimate kinase
LVKIYLAIDKVFKICKNNGEVIFLTGTIVNAIAVIVGSSIGLLLKKGIPQRFSDSVMKAVANTSGKHVTVEIR